MNLMKFFTHLGKSVVFGLSTLAAILSLIIMNLKISESTNLLYTQVFVLRAESIVGSIVIGAVAALIIKTVIILTARTEESEFRTIYSNDQDIEVYVVTYENEKIFAGEQISHKIVSSSGVLHLKKNGASVRQCIDHIEYLGLNQHGSKVDKIEYAEKSYNRSFFGLELLDDYKTSHLKIYLKDPRSEEQLEEIAKTEESLRSFLHGKSSI